VKNVLLILLALPLLVSALAADTSEEETGFTSDGHTTDSLEKVKQQVTKGKAVLLDVREPSEWDEGHLKSSDLLPLSVIRNGRLTDAQKKLLPNDKPVYCHCRSGARVLIVSEILREQGYDIRPLRAGYSTLIKAGFKKAPSKSDN
jgi:phage shock protein E